MQRKFLDLLLGGRPMERLVYLFTDWHTGQQVFLYRDRLGRHWMAPGRWSLFRVKYANWDRVFRGGYD